MVTKTALRLTSDSIIVENVAKKVKNPFE